MARICYDKDGYETKASIKREISEKFGFKLDSIELMEASYGPFTKLCNGVSFTVCGRGYWTDLVGAFMFAPAWDDKKERDVR